MSNLIYKLTETDKAVRDFKQIEADARCFPNRSSMVERWKSPLLFIIDLLSWSIAIFATVHAFPWKGSYITLIWIGPLFGVIALYLIGSYNERADFLSFEYLSEHFIGLLFSMIFSMCFVYLVSTYKMTVKPSRLYLPFLFSIYSIISIFCRRLLGKHILRQHVNSAFLVLGDESKSEEFERLYSESGLNRKLEFKKLDPNKLVQGSEVPSSVESEVIAMLLSKETNYAAVLLACQTENLSPQLLQCLVQTHCSGIPVLTMSAFLELHWHRLSSEFAGPDWLFNAELTLAHGTVFSHIKRFVDIVCSGVALVVLSPLLLLIGFLIHWESHGPAIFAQERVGRQGKFFTLYKFRTMRMNDDISTTTITDNRITRIGRFLRVSRLDEILQLWNVLIGDMSIIGPRAEWVKCAEVYEKEIPHYHIRHLIKPGITGWAQVKFRYGENTSDAIEKFEYDLYYIRHYSFKMDLRIVVKTIYTMLSGTGR